MCEQLEREVNPDEIPPEIDDFPEEIQLAIMTYSKLGDRVQADIGYLGKDYTTLQLHMDLQRIENKDLFVETILRLDERTIKKSAEEMKRERKKLEKR